MVTMSSVLFWAWNNLGHEGVDESIFLSPEELRLRSLRGADTMDHGNHSFRFRPEVPVFLKRQRLFRWLAPSSTGYSSNMQVIWLFEKAHPSLTAGIFPLKRDKKHQKEIVFHLNSTNHVPIMSTTKQVRREGDLSPHIKIFSENIFARVPDIYNLYNTAKRN